MTVCSFCGAEERIRSQDVELGSSSMTFRSAFPALGYPDACPPCSKIVTRLVRNMLGFFASEGGSKGW